MESWKVLLGRPLVLVAHPDDEALGCSALLQRAQSPAVILADMQLEDGEVVEAEPAQRTGPDESG